MLKPVERTEDPESPETSMEPEKIGAGKNDDAKVVKDAKTSMQKTEYAEMINQRPPSQAMMTPLAKAPTDSEHVAYQAAPAYPVPSGGPLQGYPVPGGPVANAHLPSGNGPAPMFPNAPIHMGVPGGMKNLKFKNYNLIHVIMIYCGLNNNTC